jgi:type III secretory pathway component EscS
MNPVISEALIAALFISLVPMAAISLGAGAVALLQAITQVQEQSMVHFARIVVLVLVMLWGAHEAFASLESIFLKVLSLCATLGRS